MSKRHRKRVSREHTKQNAEKGGRSGNDWFKLPDNVGKWQPDKANRFSIDILPYEVKMKDHPDEVEQGCLWYKLPFSVHHNIGPTNDSFVCPRSLGKPCCVCDERDRLFKEDSDKNEDLIKSLRPQKFVAYNIKSQEDQDRVDVMVLSRGKFASPLEDELKDPDNEEHLAFFDVTEDGRTLRVRFSEETFLNNKFLQATKIDFKPRDAMDEDEVLEKVVCLDEALILPDNEDLRKAFFQEDDDEETETKKDATEAENPDDEDQDTPPDDGDEDGDEDEDGDGEENLEPNILCPQCGETFEQEDAEHSKTLGDFCSKKCLRKAEKEAEKEAEDKEDADEPEAKPEPKGKKCQACGGTGKSSKGKQCVPCGGTGKAKSTADPEPEGDDDAKKKPEKGKDATAEKKDQKNKKDKDTPECPHDGGTFGEVDQYDECDDCPYWEQCEEASE